MDVAESIICDPLQYFTSKYKSLNILPFLDTPLLTPEKVLLPKQLLKLESM